ncbi:MAG: HD domain-containing protein [Candidatus Cloacimonadales bacterium]
MTSAEMIRRTINFVQTSLAQSESGHDWWHIHRVQQLATTIAQNEPDANLLVVELAALLHDIADAKFHAGNEQLAPQISGRFLQKLGLENELIDQILDIIKNVSFRHEFGAPAPQILELQIVQDADRLDAMGAIGIARAFSYGGYKMREMYNPEIKPVVYANSDEYKTNTAPRDACRRYRGVACVQGCG